MKVKMLLDNGFNPDLRVYKEAQYLIKNNNDVEIICLDKKNQYIDNPVENIDGIKIRRFFVRTEKTTNLIENNAIIRKLKYLIYFWWLIKFLKQAKKYLKQEEYDVLHCHDLIMAFFGCLLFRNKKIIFDMHEYYKDKNIKIRNKIIDKMVKYTQNRATWIIHVNDFQLKDIKEKNKSKLVYLPNYPEENDYLPIDKVNSNFFRVNYIGFLRDYNALKNLTQIAEADKNIYVTLYGAGDCYDLLKKEIKIDNVQIYGAFNGHTDSAKIYSNTDVLYCVYDSNDNNWKNAYPVKLYEGIITKTPIIVSKDTMAAELIKKYNIGEAVKYDDIDELNKAIQKIKNNYNIYRENLEKIHKNYMWSDIVRNMDVIYK